MKKEFKEAIEDSPIIAAIKDDEGLKKCLTSESRVIFILYGDICNIPDIVETVKSSGKIAMVHIDLIAGLSSKEIAVDFIQKYTKAERTYRSPERTTGISARWPVDGSPTDIPR